MSTRNKMYIKEICELSSKEIPIKDESGLIVGLKIPEGYDVEDMLLAIRTMVGCYYRQESIIKKLKNPLSIIRASVDPFFESFSKIQEEIEERGGEYPSGGY